MVKACQEMPTVGAIARRLKRPLHRIEYLIRSRGLQPCGRAGNARIFSEDQVDYIASELSRIEAERGDLE